MIKLFFIFLFICGFFISNGCSSGNDETAFVFGKGKYNFVMSDSTGKEFIRGILNVEKYDKGQISGKYEFKKISNKDFDGFSSMNGEFSGDVNDKEKTVFINTNPRIADSNVFWNLKLRKNNLSGSWQYSVFRGKMNGGKVKITSIN